MKSTVFAERRARFMEGFGAGVAVFPAEPVHIRNNDVEHEWRQHSDLYYLSGFDEPESVLVLCDPAPKGKTKKGEGPYAVLFVRPRDPSREVWDGPRAGVEGALARYGADEAFPIEELDKRLPGYLEDHARLCYRLGGDPDFDRRMIAALGWVRRRARAGVLPPSAIHDPSDVLHEQRLRKSEGELERMRAALAITKEAHERAMQVARPGGFEHEVEAEIQRVFRSRGGQRPAYGPIVGSGPNATILHYRANNRQMKEGELLLIDAGVELDYYASDITRTFPIRGRFSEPQRAIYEVVLRSQEAAIEAVRPGATLRDVHEAAVRVIASGLVELGLIEGPVGAAIEEGRYKDYYMHRTSHWLGMDVHDVGRYFEPGGEPRALEPGFVLTVEPGIYIAEEAPVPQGKEAFRGIGVRIEDDILVTAEGYENLSAAIPKSIADIEALTTG